MKPRRGAAGTLKLAPYRAGVDGAVVEAPAQPLGAALARLLNGERARRVLNVLVAVVAVIVLAPFMALIALAVRMTSRGPVIYSQTRVGVDRRSPGLPSGNWRRQGNLGGRPFTIYKFRTMYEEGDAPQVWATPDDPRVTPVGRLLRKFRLDELPQLFNVIKGDMNVVGPRPEQPDIFTDLRDDVAGYQHRQRVLPGITGWAQINQSYDTCLEDVRRKVDYDLDYIRNRSAARDLTIMVQTLPVLVGKKGAW